MTIFAETIWTPQKLHTLQWPLALQLFGGDRRHLVGLILRDVDIFMIQIKGKRCGNFRVIERLFLRRALPIYYCCTYWLLLFRRKQHDNFRSVFKGVIYNVLHFKVNIIALFWLMSYMQNDLQNLQRCKVYLQLASPAMQEIGKRNNI